jgi:hypothetical protein
MAAAVRVTFGRRSRQKGTTIGVQVNTFGIDKLLQEVTGDNLIPILFDAMQPSFDEAYNEWPVLTGASQSTIALVEAERGERRARVALQAGGPALITHRDNKSHKDYAPFIEFNGTATAAPGILVRAVYSNDSVIKQRIRDGIRALIARR